MQKPLDEIATLVQSLTYAEMMEVSEAIWKGQPEGSAVTQESLPALLHRWSKSRSAAAHDASEEMPSDQRVLFGDVLSPPGDQVDG
jgi:hypothetical protein